MDKIFKKIFETGYKGLRGFFRMRRHKNKKKAILSE